MGLLKDVEEETNVSHRPARFAELASRNFEPNLGGVRDESTGCLASVTGFGMPAKSEWLFLST